MWKLKRHNAVPSALHGLERDTDAGKGRGKWLKAEGIAGVVVN
eukprot:CAMPEP_0117655750 /NCGR_PEP_ID=MMETSP0804-20121206/4444_1 /TAXON_ID=1074897 /ORGANISM="Tetraselmis astigmatica, Strain CCMP880" /LENGTH=42 /DNA_ID= /DNA_START= /DNA_END= /DNA_ORIENTATION=